MKTAKLADLLTFTQGINSARAETQYKLKNPTYYDQTSFESDYQQEETKAIEKIPTNDYSLKLGDIVISNFRQQAAIITKANAGKVPSINFTKVDFKNDNIDKDYFLYIFNNYKKVQAQKYQQTQGSTIPKMTLKSLNELKIPLPPIQEQKIIGQIYKKTINLRSLLNKQSQLIGDFTNTILEKNLKEK
jgi:restriction endonuclease S subunit